MLIGKKLGKYEITELIARGGMAYVYKATHPRLGRDVAIKVMLGYLALSDEFRIRFQREAESIAKLRHPNIIHIYDMDIENEHYYMVMEYINGGTLQNLLNRHDRLTPIHALDILIPIADALVTSHAAGIIHRDIKPANILFAEPNFTHPILTDFGITMIEGTTSLTMSGKFVGTPSYMSPEAGLNEPIDQRTDIYSMGVTLYQLLTGELPYIGDTPFDMFMGKLHESFRDPYQFAPDLPSVLVPILKKSIEANKKKRYQTILEFKLALEEAREIIRSENPPIATQHKHKDSEATRQLDLSEARSKYSENLNHPSLDIHKKYRVFVIITLILLAGFLVTRWEYFQNLLMPTINSDLQSGSEVAYATIDEIIGSEVLTFWELDGIDLPKSSTTEQQITAQPTATIVPTSTSVEQTSNLIVEEATHTHTPQPPTPTPTVMPSVTQLPPSPTQTPIPVQSLEIGNRLNDQMIESGTVHSYTFTTSSTIPTYLFLDSTDEKNSFNILLQDMKANEVITQMTSFASGICIEFEASQNLYQLTIDLPNDIRQLRYDLSLMNEGFEHDECQNT